MSSKVKDGLFLGDIDAAQDAEFLQLNGIVHIINCVPRQVPNLFQQSLGLAYVACDLEEVLRRPFFDLKNRQFMAIVQLIDRALEQTESVLVHSLNGLNRSPSVMMGYLMVKYCWGVDKAYEFLLSKRGDIKPHESYIDQLCLLEAQLQTQFGSRATEQQLYEWHPALADPRIDEIVLVHTYLNALSASKPLKKEPNKPPASRRLSWIDQSSQMKKLYPSLMIKPERPPNHSYSDMLPANGWVDLINAANASAGPAPKPIAAFLDSSSASSNAMLRANDQADVDDDDDDDDAAVVNRGRRVHSFSVPQRRDIEVEPGSPVSDREEQDLTIDVATAASSSTLLLPRQPVSRHQQQLRSVATTTAGPMRQQQQQQQQQIPRSAMTRPATTSPSLSSSQYASGSVSSAANPAARTPLSSYTNGAVTSTTMSSTSKASTAKKVPDYAKPIKPGSRTTTTTTSTPARTFSATAPSLAPAKQPLDRRSSSSSAVSTGSYSARGSYTGDLPLPQTQSAFSVRRAVAEADSWASASVNAASSSRPRTAPPRMRKKDSDPTLFQSKTKPSVDASFLSTVSITGGISRVSLDVSALPAGVGRRLSGADYSASAAFNTNAASFRTQKLSGRSGSAQSAAQTATPSATASTAASRSKAMRAHWK